MEAIVEVKVQKSNYSANSGGFGYSVINVVTMSGGRSFMATFTNISATTNSMRGISSPTNSI
jgi:hypothetical protein